MDGTACIGCECARSEHPQSRAEPRPPPAFIGHRNRRERLRTVHGIRTSVFLSDRERSNRSRLPSGWAGEGTSRCLRRPGVPWNLSLQQGERGGAPVGSRPRGGRYFIYRPPLGGSQPSDCTSTDHISVRVITLRSTEHLSGRTTAPAHRV
jgi:hypothetical protein